jgi:type II secretory ATPase GspE/PulE/Tfp pilus assembly ATPase PilB-like protein
MMADKVNEPSKENKENLDLHVQVPDALRRFAILQDRILYVANDYLTQSMVLDFEMRLMRMGLVTQKRGVPMQQIEKMAHNAPSLKADGNDTTERARAFGLLRQAVEMNASDIHFVLGRHHAEVKMRIDGYLGSYIEITVEEALSLVSALYVSCHASTKNSNQFNFNGPLAARLTASDGLPPKLYAVRFASTPSDANGLVVLRLLYDEISSRNAGRKRLGEVLVDQQLITEDQLNQALAEQSKSIQPGIQSRYLGDILVTMGMLEEKTLAEAVRMQAVLSERNRALGFSDKQIALIHDMADAPKGMVIIVGPTGAGKSTTLKAAMEWIHETYPHFNLLTVEDPPEYPITGASAQIPVKAQGVDSETGAGRGELYASIIADTLRLDPDILMVGEIRDGHSAQAGLRAAETGHRLWTSLHANDAWEALNRLMDLLRESGMMDPMSVLANTQNLAGTMAQRLIPMLCPHCKVPLKGHHERLSTQITRELMDAIPDIDPTRIFLRGDGCKKCVPNAEGDPEKQKADKRRGILGRTVVAEIVVPDQALLDIVRKEGVPAARYFWLKHRDGRVLMDHALEKIQAGIVAPDVVREFAGPLISSRQVLAQMDRGKI